MGRYLANMDFVFPLCLGHGGGHLWRSELGHTSGDTDGNVGQSGDSIRGPGEEASNDLHRPIPIEQKKTEGNGVFGYGVSLLSPPLLRPMDTIYNPYSAFLGRTGRIKPCPRYSSGCQE